MLLLNEMFQLVCMIDDDNLTHNSASCPNKASAIIQWKRIPVDIQHSTSLPATLSPTMRRTHFHIVQPRRQAQPSFLQREDH